MSKQTIAFNTGRPYSADGQRIAARQLKDGHVFFVDATRNLYYVTDTPCELEPAAVMRAYDWNRCSSPWALQGTYGQISDLVEELRAAARTVAAA